MRTILALALCALLLVAACGQKTSVDTSGAKVTTDGTKTTVETPGVEVTQNDVDTLDKDISSLPSGENTDVDSMDSDFKEVENLNV